MSGWMSAAPTGRRNARRARLPRIVRAQAGSSFSVFGTQVKIFVRLGVVPRPVEL